MANTTRRRLAEVCFWAGVAALTIVLFGTTPRTVELITALIGVVLFLAARWFGAQQERDHRG
ncbi:hypothetical protein BDK92_7202 [Micromonospora pisi]|uniref:Uncharacterized protein n=1 Tax=Micromonospora pisi TaxID=589240 RepID=A0A495JWU0_9ACTN|nr:hypothetical protein [Micromonospora pisi]RKR92724.1 hypothetical protein BDK92_7202 [Micromonospora pisi]